MTRAGENDACRDAKASHLNAGRKEAVGDHLRCERVVWVRLEAQRAAWRGDDRHLALGDGGPSIEAHIAQHRSARRVDQRERGLVFAHTPQRLDVFGFVISMTLLAAWLTFG